MRPLATPTAQVVREVRWAAILVSAVVLAPFGALIAGGLTGDTLAGALGLVLSAVVASGVVWSATRARTIRRASMHAAVGTMLASGVAVPLLWTIVVVLEGASHRLGEIPLGIAIGVLMGGALAAPAGIALAVPSIAVVRETLAPTAATRTMMIATLGGWAAGCSALHLVLGWGAAWVGWLGVAIGGAVAAAAYRQLLWHHRWLVRVRRGEVPGFAIVPASELEHSPDLLPWAPGATRAALLVREARGEAGAYRAAPVREAIAFAGT